MWTLITQHLDVVTAIASAFATMAAIAGIALAFHGARAEREYRKLLLQPSLELTSHYRYKDRMPGKKFVEISLLNTGLGPARITAFELELDGRRYNSFQDWLVAVQLLPPGNPLNDPSHNVELFDSTRFQEGKIIPSRSAVQLLQYNYDNVDPASIPDFLLEQMLAGFFYNLQRTKLRFACQSLLGGSPQSKIIEGAEWNIPLKIALAPVPPPTSGQSSI
ncbi:MAG: hypothetical protein HY304_09925 [candidate division Zixibacteria bacterium]|nr:hypothetical protein [candidate division Zixibacteria bacterium]